MKKVKLVIEIDEEVKDFLDGKGDCLNIDLYSTLIQAVQRSTLLSAEFEKVKAEINLEDIDCQYEEDYVYSGGLQKAIEIIDKHIKEIDNE